MDIGSKIAQARREQGITQIELADQMCVTRQTISRWETGAALPDIEKTADLAEILQVSCDYLLREHSPETDTIPQADNSSIRKENTAFPVGKNNLPDKNSTYPADKNNAVPANNAWNKNKPPKNKNAVTKLLSDIVGKKVRITFYEDEEDYDLIDEICTIDSFKGNWICLTLSHQTGSKQKKLTDKAFLPLECFPHQAGDIQKKLVALSSVLSFEIIDSEESIEK